MKDLDQNKPKPANALDELGHAFIKIPRRILWQFFHGSGDERQLATLYLILFYHCAYQDDTFHFGNQFICRKKGEWIGTTDQLAAVTATNCNRVRYLLEKLSENKQIRIRRIFRGMRITVVGYAEYTRAAKSRDETPQERYQREWDEMVNKLNHGKYV